MASCGHDLEVALRDAVDKKKNFYTFSYVVLSLIEPEKRNDNDPVVVALKELAKAIKKWGEKDDLQ